MSHVTLNSDLSKILLCISSQGQDLYLHQKLNMYIYWFSSERGYRRRQRRRRQQHWMLQYNHYGDISPIISQITDITYRNRHIAISIQLISVTERKVKERITTAKEDILAFNARLRTVVSNFCCPMHLFIMLFSFTFQHCLIQKTQKMHSKNAGCYAMKHHIICGYSVPHATCLLCATYQIWHHYSIDIIILAKLDNNWKYCS